MTCVDAILSVKPLSDLERVTKLGGDREVAGVCLAERFSDLESAPAGSFVILGRVASESAIDYRFDMALRWAALGGAGRRRGGGRVRRRNLATAGHGGGHREPSGAGTDLDSLDG
ncbi:MAG TPA: hypothetical protein VMU94_15150 [Streptosporangiaceae bacterium]|nr:hypothetical protein [Streptosporangiaceae bacterium]